MHVPLGNAASLRLPSPMRKFEMFLHVHVRDATVCFKIHWEGYHFSSHLEFLHSGVSPCLCCHHNCCVSMLVPRTRLLSSTPLSFILSWEMLQ